MGFVGTGVLVGSCVGAGVLDGEIGGIVVGVGVGDSVADGVEVGDRSGAPVFVGSETTVVGRGASNIGGSSFPGWP